VGIGRRYLPIFAAISLLTPLAVGINANSEKTLINSNQEVENFIPGRLLVKFSRVSPVEAFNLLNGVLPGAEILKEFYSVPGLYLVKLPDGTSVREALRVISEISQVVYAEPDYVVKATKTPDDPYYQKQWGLEKVGAPLAWNETTGNEELVVAVIDTGIDYTHEDLKENVWSNPNEIPDNGKDDDGNGYIDDIHGINTVNTESLNSNSGCGSSGKDAGNPMDDNGHGTHVAGIIGAVSNNSTGVAGVNWSVKLLACKFMDSEGRGSVSAAIECLDYIKKLRDEEGIEVIVSNNSWGGSDYSSALEDAIKAQEESGILFVAAAGNDGEDNDSTPQYPASYDVDNIISVAATDRSDSLADFSNYGRQTVDLGAPGVGILSTYLSNDGNYKYMSGTSMATPFVTGTVALLKAKEPGLNWYEVRNLILTGGDEATGLRGKTLTGKRLSAYGALNSESKLFEVLYPLNGKTYSKDQPVELKTISVKGKNPEGEVSVEIVPQGDVVILKDDGSFPDQVPEDGIFTGSYKFKSSGKKTLIFRNGSEERIVEITVE